MNHYLDLIGMLSKTNLELEMTRVQTLVKCANGTHLSIISNGYGCQDGLLELMPVTPPVDWSVEPPGFLTADQAMLLIQMYGEYGDDTYIGEEE